MITQESRLQMLLDGVRDAYNDDVIKAIFNSDHVPPMDTIAHLLSYPDNNTARIAALHALEKWIGLCEYPACPYLPDDRALLELRTATKEDPALLALRLYALELYFEWTALAMRCALADAEGARGTWTQVQAVTTVVTVAQDMAAAEQPADWARWARNLLDRIRALMQGYAMGSEDQIADAHTLGLMRLEALLEPLTIELVRHV